MASFNFVPALKLTALEAAMSIGWPVDGFLPARAARSFTEKLTNPGNTMESPLASRPVRQLIRAFKALSESTLVSPDVSLMDAISSFLFILSPLNDVLYSFDCLMNRLTSLDVLDS